MAGVLRVRHEHDVGRDASLGRGEVARPLTTVSAAELCLMAESVADVKVQTLVVFMLTLEAALVTCSTGCISVHCFVTTCGARTVQNKTGSVWGTAVCGGSFVFNAANDEAVVCMGHGTAGAGAIL